VNPGAAIAGARSHRLGTAMAIDAVTANVVVALRRAGIESILLRGPAIARWLYAEGGPRGYVDIDLLVEPEKRRDAEAVLAGLGFVHREAGFAPGESVDHASEWICRRPPVAVDLHHGIEGIRAAPVALWTALRSDSKKIDVAGVPTDAPGEAALALIVTLHAAHHGRRSGKQLQELRRALHLVGLDTWQDALGLAERLDAVRSFAAGLRLLPEGAALAERLRLPRGGDRVTALRAAGAHSTAIGFARLAATPGVRAKLTLVARKLVPTPAFMRHWSRLARRGRLGLALAYLWRPLWLLLHLVPAGVVWLRARR
jgi:putative nucleotidyltransferase-like protein